MQPAPRKEVCASSDKACARTLSQALGGRGATRAGAGWRGGCGRGEARGKGFSLLKRLALPLGRNETKFSCQCSWGDEWVVLGGEITPKNAHGSAQGCQGVEEGPPAGSSLSFAPELKCKTANLSS